MNIGAYRHNTRIQNASEERKIAQMAVRMAKNGRSSEMMCAAAESSIHTFVASAHTYTGRAGTAGSMHIRSATRVQNRHSARAE